MTDVPASDGEISGLCRSSIKRRRTRRAKQVVKAADRDFLEQASKEPTPSQSLVLDRRNENRDKLEPMMGYIYRDNEHHDVVVRAIYVCKKCAPLHTSMRHIIPSRVLSWLKLTELTFWCVNKNSLSIRAPHVVIFHMGSTTTSTAGPMKNHCNRTPHMQSHTLVVWPNSHHSQVMSPRA